MKGVVTMNMKSSLLGLAVGIVGGATAMLLSTPQSGKNVRQSLKSTKKASQEFRSEFQQRFSSIKDAVNMIKEEAQTTVPNIMTDAKGSVQKFQQETAPIQQRLKGNIDAISQSANELGQAASEMTTEVEKLVNRLTFKKQPKV